MELIDRYLQAVKFWLPKNQKQDIVAELSEDLRSQVEDREAELGRPLNEAEVGRPAQATRPPGAGGEPVSAAATLDRPNVVSDLCIRAEDRGRVLSVALGPGVDRDGDLPSCPSEPDHGHWIVLDVVLAHDVFP